MTPAQEQMMSAPKHTPGPWEVLPLPEDGLTSVLQAGDGYESGDQSAWPNSGFDIAQCFGPGQEANARLIAAAPELLAKCEKIVRWLDGLAARSEESAKDKRFVTLTKAHEADAKNYRATAKEIKQVIAKATGGDA